MAILVTDLPNYLEDYLEEMQIKGLTNKTLKNYEFAISAFIKYIEIDPTGNYPDRGCNIETYTCDVHSEIETLGTLETIQPGEAAYHTEYWQGIEGVGDVKTEKDVIKKIEPNLIDFEFGSAPGRNDFWHTPADTMDKVSQDSLLVSGRLVASLLELLDAK